ncbi:hypothetical protein C8J57DRAFT_1561977 [Mycena rebaudengoi]|nr:hypothetical protein C8J57DRAFT_1561977 [Mycena rebaudengoi]
MPKLRLPTSDASTYAVHKGYADACRSLLLLPARYYRCPLRHSALRLVASTTIPKYPSSTPRQRQPRPIPPAARTARGACVPRRPRRLCRLPAQRDHLRQSLTLSAPRRARATSAPYRRRRLLHLIRHRHLLPSLLNIRGWVHHQHDTDHDGRPLHLLQPFCTVSDAFVASPSIPATFSSPHPSNMTRSLVQRTPPPARAHHLQPRPAFTTRLPTCTYLGAVPSATAYAVDIPHRLRHVHRTGPPCQSSPPSHRPTPTPPACGTRITVAPTRGAACAGGVDPQRGDTPAKTARKHGDHLPPLQQLHAGIKISPCSLLSPFGNADTPQARYMTFYHSLSNVHHEVSTFWNCASTAGDAAHVPPTRIPPDPDFPPLTYDPVGERKSLYGCRESSPLLAPQLAPSCFALHDIRNRTLRLICHTAPSFADVREYERSTFLSKTRPVH